MKEFTEHKTFSANFIIEKFIRNIVMVIKVTLQECLNSMLVSEMNMFATKNDLIKLVDTFMRHEDEPEFDFTFTFDHHEMEIFLKRAALFVPKAMTLR
jgi:hypothetical protein